MSKRTTPVRLECHICKHETEHKILCRDEKEGKYSLGADYPEQQSGRWSVVSEVLQCLGCREFTIRRTANDSEAEYPNEDLYPPRRAEQKRVPPDWAASLPDGIYWLLMEVYSAIQTRSYRLAAMGLRALMDELMTQTVGDIGGFDEKVKKMVSEGNLSKVQKSVLDPTLELGHAATHRSHRPSGPQLDAALAIVEGMLHLFCIQTQVVDKLKAGVKPRQPRQKLKADSKPQAQKLLKIASRRKSEPAKGTDESTPR